VGRYTYREILVNEFDDELIKKYPLWLTILTAVTTFSILRGSRILEYPYWYGLIAVVVFVPCIYQVWFKIRTYKLGKLKSSLKSGIKVK
jgi:hypothetical protein